MSRPSAPAVIIIATHPRGKTSGSHTAKVCLRHSVPLQLLELPKSSRSTPGTKNCSSPRATVSTKLRSPAGATRRQHPHKYNKNSVSSANPTRIYFITTDLHATGQAHRPALYNSANDECFACGKCQPAPQAVLHSLKAPTPNRPSNCHLLPLLLRKLRIQVLLHFANHMGTRQILRGDISYSCCNSIDDTLYRAISRLFITVINGIRPL